MPPSIAKLLCGPTFEFLVGPEKTLFSLHVDLVTKHSEPLGRLMRGGMKESSDGVANIQDFSVDTFARFVDFMYTGNYNDAEREILSEAEQGGSTNGLKMGVNTGWESEIRDHYESTEDQFIDYIPSKKAKKRKSSNKSPLLEELEAFASDLQMPRAKTYKLSQNTEADGDFSRIFFNHAELYHLAEVYFVEDLKTLCLKRLSKTLLTFQMSEERVTDIAHLIEYAYSKTPKTRALWSLRTVVTRFAACEIEAMKEHDSFNELLENFGEFAADLIKDVIRRLG